MGRLRHFLSLGELETKRCIFFKIYPCPSVFNNEDSYYEVDTLPFQIIIPGIWTFSLIFNIPLFLVTKIGTQDNSHYCVEIFPERWMEKAYPLTWIALTNLSLAIMVFLYSKVVRTLWFKRNDDTQLTCQQKVSVTIAVSCHTVWT